MFSGEAEIQARRRTLAVLQDEIRTVLDAARDLSQAYDFLLQNDQEGLQGSIEKIRKSEDDAESLRRTLTRELGEIGNMLMNRDDLLRTSYDIEEIGGFISGTAFRFYNLFPRREDLPSGIPFFRRGYYYQRSTAGNFNHRFSQTELYTHSYGNGKE